MIVRVNSERRPGPNWTRMATPPAVGILSGAHSFWVRGNVRVISSLVEAELPDGSGVGPQWHMSISRGGKRPKAGDVDKALKAFGMVGAEEDNHHPGYTRNFWMPVDPAHRVDCQCKTDEKIVVDPADGYTWTNPEEQVTATATDCRGCELEQIMGKPCPIHQPTAAP